MVSGDEHRHWNSFVKVPLEAWNLCWQMCYRRNYCRAIRVCLDVDVVGIVCVYSVYCGFKHFLSQREFHSRNNWQVFTFIQDWPCQNRCVPGNIWWDHGYKKQSAITKDVVILRCIFNEYHWISTDYLLTYDIYNEFFLRWSSLFMFVPTSLKTTGPSIWLSSNHDREIRNEHTCTHQLSSDQQKLVSDSLNWGWCLGCLVRITYKIYCIT